MANETPMQRYEWATGPDGWLTAWGWERLAADLDAAASRLSWSNMGPVYKLRDRAADCRARAAAIRARALDTLRDISRPL